VTPLDQTSFCNPGPPRDCWVFDPVVTETAQSYPSIQINAGDRVTIDAGGCVQTGGKGLTWKRYVDPIASNGLYHGSILIPGMDSLVQLRFMVGQTVVAGEFGYQDDGYSDNGYYAHDNGTSNQCRDLGDAWVHLTIN